MDLLEISQEIDNGDYHTGEGVSHSGLQVFRRDVREYHWKYVLGNHDRDRKDYFDFGSAVHEMVLLQDDANIELIPDDVLSANGAKSGKAWKEFEAEHAGSLLLKDAEYKSVLRCVEAVYSHPLAGKLLVCDGPAERAFRYTRDDGLGLKCKPDKLAVTPHGVCIVDLKTTDNPYAGGFAKSVVSYCYDMQAWYYRNILEALGMDVVEFFFIAVGKSQPHSVNVFTLTQDDLMRAGEIAGKALEELARRTIANDWMPHGMDRATQLTLPRYAQNRSDYE